jgi:hypothetical protein
MTANTVAWLRAHASRGDYASMARFAAALYAQGLRTWEVLLECYEVDFPEEFFVINADRLATPHLLAFFTNQPWRLCVPPSEGGSQLTPLELTDEAERAIFTRDPDLVPLMQLIGPRTTWEDTVICYRMTELQAGSTAVFGSKATADPAEEIVRCGESLLAILHAHHVEYLRGQEWILRQPWNRGFGAVDTQSVDQMRSLVERIENRQRDVASRRDRP